MEEVKRQYIAIDLKSFYASVECMDRGLDPLTTNLVVADLTRTEKTICLAVSPSLKAYGIGGRARLFEAVEQIKQANNIRRARAPGHRLTGESYDARALAENPHLAVSYIVAPPQMARYMEISTQIYNVYLKYISPDDIHVYSIDEVFIDATCYLRTYRCTAHELALRMIRDVLATTGITATAGIGTNLYLAKIAMDIMAKKMPADEDGVRIAELDELSYRRRLWDHTPLTSFWRVGKGISKKLEAYGMHTMGDVARYSLQYEDLLYRLFGVNAELLIDHAWGREPCLISDIKAYRPESNSISQGQVMSTPYPFDKARLIVHEMIDLLALTLVEKRLVTDQLVLDIGYDIENVKKGYRGEVTTDPYGREIPKHAHGTGNIGFYTSSTRHLTDTMLALFDRIMDPNLTMRRVSVTACRVLREGDAPKSSTDGEQIDLFCDLAAKEREEAEEAVRLAKERRRQEAIIELRQKYGKNAVLKGMNFEEGATTKERNGQIGGHKA